MSADTTTVSIEDARSGLTRAGFLGMSDPVRPDVADSLRQVKDAGIKLIVITGDFPNTAKHILQQLDVDIADDHIKTGTELAEMSDTQLATYLS